MNYLRFPFLSQTPPYLKILFSAKRNEYAYVWQVFYQFYLVPVDCESTVNSIKLDHVKHYNTALAQSHRNKFL
jgi:hypothetical protein